MSMAELSQPQIDVDPDSLFSQDPIPSSRKTRSKKEMLAPLKEKKKRTKSGKPAKRASVRAGLILPTARIKKIIKKRFTGSRMKSSAVIYLTAVAQGFISKVIDTTVELMGKHKLQAPPPDADKTVQNKYKQIANKRINPQFIRNAMNSDDVLSKFMGRHNCLILGGGVTQTAKVKLERDREFRNQIKRIKAQGNEQIRAIREQQAELEGEKPAKKKKSAKSKKNA